ncbi:MAG: aldo/keto reductase [Dysgonamonadaceae bacterium]|jgi:predicted aldo/keto reductase-like oxidoreductase|nr:aldo/keto reductase [Dysgonamonadaceae bacterium]
MKSKNINRRDFFRFSATMGAGVLFVPGMTASALRAPAYLRKEDKIPVRPLGKTGVQLPILSMGVMRADNPNVLRAAFNSGIFHFDTAHGYQNGRNEEMVGNFFEGKPRDTYFIATKIKSKYPLEDDFEQSLEERFAISLKRLKMDYVDIFYAHACSEVAEVTDERIIAAMQKIKSGGKARFIGFSTHAHKPEMIDAAIRTGIYDVILLSYNFKLKNLKETEEAMERAAKAGIGLIVMKSMAGGTEDAGGKKKINAQACLKWVWRNEHITTIIPGFSNYDELDECLAAVQKTELTSEEENYLAALKDREMLFCRQCGTCLSQCPSKLPIPDIMRAYMYAYGYKHAQLSKETLAELNLPENACSGCASCRVTCPSGFNVSGKIAAILPVMDIPVELLS